MLNPRQFVIIFLVGFLLSFVAGLIGGVGFGVFIIRAIVSGIIVVVLSFCAITVYNKFLATVDTLEPTEKSDENSQETEKTVDITIDDELPDTATAPSFNVADYPVQRGEVETTEVQEAQLTDAQDDGSSTFQAGTLDKITVSEPEIIENAELINDAPAEQNGTIFTTDSQREHDVSDSQLNRESSAGVDYRGNNAIEDGDTELGVLPDIESLGIEEDIDNPNAADELIQDSVFAETGETKPTAPPVPASEMGDAKEIAAAIRTALVKDM